jgi:LPXTG-motif cell wall-anchored protein
LIAKASPALPNVARDPVQVQSLPTASPALANTGAKVGSLVTVAMLLILGGLALVIRSSRKGGRV